VEDINKAIRNKEAAHNILLRELETVNKLKGKMNESKATSKRSNEENEKLVVLMTALSNRFEKLQQYHKEKIFAFKKAMNNKDDEKKQIIIEVSSFKEMNRQLEGKLEKTKQRNDVISSSYEQEKKTFSKKLGLMKTKMRKYEGKFDKLNISNNGKQLSCEKMLNEKNVLHEEANETIELLKNEQEQENKRHADDVLSLQEDIRNVLQDKTDNENKMRKEIEDLLSGKKIKLREIASIKEGLISELNNEKKESKKLKLELSHVTELNSSTQTLNLKLHEKVQIALALKKKAETSSTNLKENIKKSELQISSEIKEIKYAFKKISSDKNAQKKMEEQNSKSILKILNLETKVSQLEKEANCRKEQDYSFQEIGQQNVSTGVNLREEFEGSMPHTENSSGFQSERVARIKAEEFAAAMAARAKAGFDIKNKEIVKLRIELACLQSQIQNASDDQKI